MTSLNIKNPRTVELVRELAGRTKTSLVHAITMAVEEKLAQDDRKETQDSAEARYKRLMIFADQYARRVGEPLHSWEIDAYLYDEHGLPK